MTDWPIPKRDEHTYDLLEKLIDANDHLCNGNPHYMRILKNRGHDIYSVHVKIEREGEK